MAPPIQCQQGMSGQMHHPPTAEDGSFDMQEWGMSDPLLDCGLWILDGCLVVLAVQIDSKIGGEEERNRQGGPINNDNEDKTHENVRLCFCSLHWSINPAFAAASPSMAGYRLQGSLLLQQLDCLPWPLQPCHLHSSLWILKNCSIFWTKNTVYLLFYTRSCEGWHDFGGS